MSAAALMRGSQPPPVGHTAFSPGPSPGPDLAPVFPTRVWEPGPQVQLDTQPWGARPSLQPAFLPNPSGRASKGWRAYITVSAYGQG